MIHLEIYPGTFAGNQVYVMDLSFSTRPGPKLFRLVSRAIILDRGSASVLHFDRWYHTGRYFMKYIDSLLLE